MKINAYNDKDLIYISLGVATVTGNAISSSQLNSTKSNKVSYNPVFP